MDERTTARVRRTRLAAVLWLVAAALAVSAFGLEYRRDGTLDWVRALLAAVCLAAAAQSFGRAAARDRRTDVGAGVRGGVGAPCPGPRR